jgi:hypothetical protein
MVNQLLETSHPSTAFRPADVSDVLRPIPFPFNPFRIHLHNGHSSILLQSIRYALFSRRRRVPLDKREGIVKQHFAVALL